MFNTQLIGRRIANYRKENDMTQMDLADALGISYQAVSNWERGNSMPDIDKLKDLSMILNVSIDELLDHEQTVNTVKKVLDDETITIDEATDILPLLKPSKINEAVEENKEAVSIKTIKKLSPYLDSDKIMDLVNKTTHSSKDLLHLAPFLDQKHLIEIINKNALDDSRLLIKLAPFLDTETIDRFASNLDVNDLHRLAPFVSTGKLDEIVSKSINKDTIKQFVKLAPFLGDQSLNNIATFCLENQLLSSLKAYLPFLDMSNL